MTKTVFVGMSGGVDSSLSAYLLKQQGFNVVGVFIKVWQPDFLKCNWERERLDAMRVAAHLEIPFLTCNAEDTYKREVADYFIAEYRAGRTPNPDIMCNTHVKFGAFYAFAREHGADLIATGHYAQVLTEDGVPRLRRGVDHEKDQSYFLWNIPKEALARTVFPVGHLTKAQVRVLARKAQLPTATKDESQGICFLGQVDIPDFLKHYLTLTPGAVLTETGEHVGTHEGVEVYTIGQRHGFHIHPAHAHTDPYFVVTKDITRNTLTVSHTKPALNHAGSDLILERGWYAPLSSGPLQVQSRYRQRPMNAQVLAHIDDSLSVRLTERGEYPAEGQSCVLYDTDRVVGGGIIGRILENE